MIRGEGSPAATHSWVRAALLARPRRSSDGVGSEGSSQAVASPGHLVKKAACFVHIVDLILIGWASQLLGTGSQKAF